MVKLQQALLVQVRVFYDYNETFECFLILIFLTDKDESAARRNIFRTVHETVCTDVKQYGVDDFQLSNKAFSLFRHFAHHVLNTFAIKAYMKQDVSSVRISLTQLGHIRQIN